MRSGHDVSRVLALSSAGHNPSLIARRTGIPRATVRDWIAGRVPRALQDLRASCADCGGPEHRFDALPSSYLYLLGLYLGDGCISAHPREVYRLRIFLDLSYPGIVDACASAIREIAPRNTVHRLLRRSNYTQRRQFTNVEISAYSKSWRCLFPQHGPGKKHERRIALTKWQERLVFSDPEPLLRGLIHSDGCRFMNTGRGGWRHPRYSLHNYSEGIRGIFCDACDLLGLHWTSANQTIYVSRKADVARMDQFIGPTS